MIIIIITITFSTHKILQIVCALENKIIFTFMNQNYTHKMEIGL